MRGPFEHTGKDARRARAILETQDQVHRVTVIIIGTLNPDVSMALDDRTRQQVLGYLTLAELEKWPPKEMDTGPATATGWPEMELQLLANRPPKGWSGVAAESHARHELNEYVVTQQGNIWEARAKD